MSNYITNEQIIGNGIIKDFDLINPFKPGTLLITYNGSIFYDYAESLSNNSEIHFDNAPGVEDEVLVSYYKQSQPGTLNAIKYLTSRQIKTLSRVAGLVALNTFDAEKLIREAVGYIDAIVGYWPQYYNEVTTIPGQFSTFPRAEDDPLLFNQCSVCYPFIPQEIQTATLYAVENIFLAGAQVSADDGSGPIVSKKLGDFSYSKASQTAPQNEIDYAKMIVGSRTMALLKGFIKRTGSITMGQEVYEGNLNSRQLFLRKR